MSHVCLLLPTSNSKTAVANKPVGGILPWFGMPKWKSWLRRHRRLLVAPLAVAFLGYLVWEAHTPGEARTISDFLFLLELTGVPFLIFLYDLWSWITWSEVAAEDSRRSGLAIQGLALGGASAAMLILLLPLWSFVIKHEKVAVFWVGAGVLMAAAATV